MAKFRMDLFLPRLACFRSRWPPVSNIKKEQTRDCFVTAPLSWRFVLNWKLWTTFSGALGGGLSKVDVMVDLSVERSRIILCETQQMFRTQTFPRSDVFSLSGPVHGQRNIASPPRSCAKPEKWGSACFTYGNPSSEKPYIVYLVLLLH